jgi:hydroxymethylbilane synthase
VQGIVRTVALRIGTRGSALALAQTGQIARRLEQTGVEEVEVIPIATSGDVASADAMVGDATAAQQGSRQGPDDASHAPDTAAAPDKSRWVDAIEDALLAGEIDLAVHSAKDVPGEAAAGSELVGSPVREQAADVLCGAGGLDALGEGARVGTSSIRRVAQLRAERADLEIVPAHGNVDTRLSRLNEGRFDALVLAHAGLRRLEREDALGGVLDPAKFVPAPGQGTLALQARSEDTRVREALAPILDADAFACLLAERALARSLDATCDTPLGAYAVPAGCGCLHLRAWVGLPDGSAWIADELVGGFYDPDELGERMAERMLAVGAGGLLGRARELAG